MNFSLKMSEEAHGTALDYLLDFDDDELNRVLKFCEEIAKARHKA